jgi:aspartate-semialdehyde dehydrogenase
VSAPGGATLAWLRVLHPLGRLATLRRVTGTLLDAASAGGRAGIEAIYAESLAIFNQEDFPEPVVFGAPVAFDCLPDPGPWQAGESPREARLCAELARLLGPQLRIGVTALQIPAFVGCAAALVVEAERALEPAEAEEALRKAAGVEVWQGEGGPNLRASAGRDVVLVGRPRPDPSQPGALRLWLVADALSLAAANAVALARARLRPH